MLESNDPAEQVSFFTPTIERPLDVTYIVLFTINSFDIPSPIVSKFTNCISFFVCAFLKAPKFTRAHVVGHILDWSF